MTSYRSLYHPLYHSRQSALGNSFVTTGSPQSRYIRKVPKKLVLSEKRLCKSVIRNSDYSYLEPWIQDRDLAIKTRNNTIRELRQRNVELFKKLKRINEEIDRRVHKFKRYKRPSEANPEPERTKVNLECELESLKGMIRVYEKEQIQLSTKLKKNVGPQGILYLEQAIASRKVDCDNVVREIKAKKDQLRGLQKKVQKAVNTNDESTDEQQLLARLKKELDKTEQLMKDDEKNKILMRDRDIKIREVKETIKEVKRELNTIKKGAHVPQNVLINRNDSLNSEKDKEQLKALLKQLQAEYEAELKPQLREKITLEAEVLAARSYLASITKKNKTNSHKIVEIRRIASFSKRRMSQENSSTLLEERKKKRQKYAEKAKLLHRYSKIRFKSTRGNLKAYPTFPEEDDRDINYTLQQEEVSDAEKKDEASRSPSTREKDSLVF